MIHLEEHLRRKVEREDPTDTFPDYVSRTIRAAPTEVVVEFHELRNAMLVLSIA